MRVAVDLARRSLRRPAGRSGSAPRSNACGRRTCAAGRRAAASRPTDWAPRIDQVGALDAHHVLVATARRARAACAAASSRTAGRPGRLDVAHVPAGALDAQHVDLVADAGRRMRVLTEVLPPPCSTSLRIAARAAASCRRAARDRGDAASRVARRPARFGVAIDPARSSSLRHPRRSPPAEAARLELPPPSRRFGHQPVRRGCVEVASAAASGAGGRSRRTGAVGTSAHRAVVGERSAPARAPSSGGVAARRGSRLGRGRRTARCRLVRAGLRTALPARTAAARSSAARSS